MNKYTVIAIFFFYTSLTMSQKYETQQYNVLEEIDNIEIRYYPSAAMIKVSNEIGRNNNFGKLFRYIAGNNNKKEKIAMTTPVYIYDENKTMEFVLPKKFISSEIPIPNDNEVEAYVSEPRYFAAIRYSGYNNKKKEDSHIKELLKVMENNDFDVIGNHYVLSYDAPTKFYNRRNEIIIEIDYSN